MSDRKDVLVAPRNESSSSFLFYSQRCPSSSSKTPSPHLVVCQRGGGAVSDRGDSPLFAVIKVPKIAGIFVSHPIFFSSGFQRNFPRPSIRAPLLLLCAFSPTATRARRPLIPTFVPWPRGLPFFFSMATSKTTTNGPPPPLLLCENKSGRRDLLSKVRPPAECLP